VLEDSVFDVFPNPIYDRLIINYTGTAVSSFDVQLISLDGVLVYSQQHNDLDNQIIDIHHLASAIYILSIKYDKGHVIKKLITE